MNESYLTKHKKKGTILSLSQRIVYTLIMKIYVYNFLYMNACEILKR